MDENMALVEFLEAALKELMEQNPQKVVVAYLDADNCVTFSYRQCGYADLQHIGQEMMNEGILRLVANSEDRLQELKDEDGTEEE